MTRNEVESYAFDLENEVRRLQRVIREYGAHKSSCRSHYLGSQRGCNCGLDEALEVRIGGL